MSLSPRPEVGGLLADQDVEPYLDHSNDTIRTASQQDQQKIRRKPVSVTSNTYQVQSESSLEEPVRQTENKMESNSPPEVPPPAYDGNMWSPGLWGQFPYRGAIALLGALACIVASIVVLVVSDGQPISSWTVSPTVYLAALMTGTNMLAHFAFTEGVKVSWWYRALRGSTVADLHHQWAHGDSIWAALFSGRRFNVIALGSIAVTVLVIDQPLIQRASSVVTVPKRFPVNVTASIAPEIPWGFTAYETGRGETSWLMTQPMTAAFNDFNSQTPIQSGFSGCTDTCKGYVEAGGLAAMCNATVGLVDNLPAVEQSTSPFSVSFSVHEASENITQSTYILMNVAYTNNSNLSECSGTLTQRTCYLAPATLRYPITLTGDTLTIGDTVGNATIQSFQPSAAAASSNMSNTDVSSEYVYWTIAGLYLSATSLFSSNATYTNGGAISTYLNLPDTLSNQFIITPKQNLSGLQGSYNLSVPHDCNQNWTDPTSHILTSLNAIAFRVSLSAATFPYRNTSKPPQAQVITMEQTSNINVYHSEYRFLIASTILATVCALLVLPSFLGWWDLGRRVSLSPVETAKAFDAPLLQGPGSNASLQQLVRRVGTRGVRFGEVEDYAAASGVRRLKFADPSEVIRPRDGVVYE
ncbi:hypothetical protein EG329_007677 [Mollisiaceae sp. DMI_Dod_QoI]|nr:hypothetical protein EG329_007677 [Helotiales sp. DMI_Dod_QoI]